jgi:hypothetical protein
MSSYRFLRCALVLSISSIENGKRLAQRAIRGTGHCEFTIAEQVSAFKAMVRWEEEGLPASGDDVLSAYEVSSPTYGCNYTENTFTEAEQTAGLPDVRMAVERCLF